MEKYYLKQLPDGGIYIDHGSCMFPSSLEDEINKLAGKTITKHGPALGGFFDGFINSFHISSEFTDLFLKEVGPAIFEIHNDGSYYIKKELINANEI